MNEESWVRHRLCEWLQFGWRQWLSSLKISKNTKYSCFFRFTSTCCGVGCAEIEYLCKSSLAFWCQSKNRSLFFWVCLFILFRRVLQNHPHLQFQGAQGLFRMCFSRSIESNCQWMDQLILNNADAKCQFQTVWEWCLEHHI